MEELGKQSLPQNQLSGEGHNMECTAMQIRKLNKSTILLRFAALASTTSSCLFLLLSLVLLTARAATSGPLYVGAPPVKPHTPSPVSKTPTPPPETKPHPAPPVKPYTPSPKLAPPPRSNLSSNISTRQETRMRARVRSEVQGEPEEEAVHEGLHRMLQALQLRSSWLLRHQQGSLRQVLLRHENRRQRPLHPLPLVWPFRHLNAYASFN